MGLIINKKSLSNNHINPQSKKEVISQSEKMQKSHTVAEAKEVREWIKLIYLNI